MAYPPVPANQRPHPVFFDVEYPERLSRWKIFVKWLFAFPHYIVLALLGLVAQILAIFAWFAILFTGRYPKGIFDLSAGYLRWSANVAAYTGLLRDEYPPFSLEAGEYALLLDIPRAERQSRLRLFIRPFALIPNYFVFYFVQLAGTVVTIIAWFAILFTARYPRGLFRFYAGVLRWQQRQMSYALLLRDEFPPYSISAGARPGNEVISAIIGVPLVVVLAALSLTLFLLPIIRVDTVTVGSTVLNDPEQLSAQRPSGDAGNLEITLLGYDPDAALPPGVVDAPGTFNEDLTHLIAFEVEVEKEGWMPAVYAPFLFFVDMCVSGSESADQATSDASTEFRIFFGGGSERSTIYFWTDPIDFPCSLTYFNLGGGRVKFEFE